MQDACWLGLDAFRAGNLCKSFPVLGFTRHFRTARHINVRAGGWRTVRSTRAAVMPALMSFISVSTSRHAGPRVHTILDAACDAQGSVRTELRRDTTLAVLGMHT